MLFLIRVKPNTITETFKTPVLALIWNKKEKLEQNLEKEKEIEKENRIDRRLYGKCYLWERS